VHGPAAAVPVSKAARAPVASRNLVGFMTLSPGCVAKAAPRADFDVLDINRERAPTFRTNAAHLFALGR
jgi:hypothetical protein